LFFFRIRSRLVKLVLVIVVVATILFYNDAPISPYDRFLNFVVLQVERSTAFRLMVAINLITSNLMYSTCETRSVF